MATKRTARGASERRWVKYLAAGGRLSFALSLFALAWNLKSPYLFAYRALALPLLLLLASLGIFYELWRTRFVLSKLCGTPWFWISLLAMAVGAEREISWRQAQAFVLQRHFRESPDIRKLGLRFIVGYEKPEMVEPLARQGLIGGIFVTARNARGKSAEQLRDEIAALQALRKEADLPPLIVATDQEGGIVSRLSPPLPRRTALSELAAVADENEQVRRAYAYGLEQGGELAALGVTLNFAPVLDLKAGREEKRLDFHSRIGWRAISADPDTVARIAQGYAQGLQARDITPTLKHFPGLGRVPEDTHHFTARLDVPGAELRAYDWRPFIRLMEGSESFVMLGHVILPEIDAERPVSFSRAVVQRILRDEFRYRGPLVTDDLTMRAAYRHGICDAAVDALNAGVDLLLISYDYEKYYEAMKCAIDAGRAGTLDAGLLAESETRLAHWHGQRHNRVISSVPSDFSIFAGSVEATAASAADASDRISP